MNANVTGEALDHIYQHARTFVGVTQQIPLGRIRKRDIQRFAVAVGHLAPEFFDEAAARSAGYNGLACPPLFLSAVLGWHAGPFESDLLPDGNAPEPLGAVPLDDLRLMGGGQELTFHEPVIEGTEVVMRLEVDDIQHKEGRSGPLLVLVVLRRYVDEQERLLLDCRETFLAR